MSTLAGASAGGSRSTLAGASGSWSTLAGASTSIEPMSALGISEALAGAGIGPGPKIPRPAGAGASVCRYLRALASSGSASRSITLRYSLGVMRPCISAARSSAAIWIWSSCVGLSKQNHMVPGSMPK